MVELQSLSPREADRTLAAADVAVDRADRVGEPVNYLMVRSREAAPRTMGYKECL